MIKKFDSNKKAMTLAEYKALPKKKVSKYRNVKKTFDGKTFDSMKEYRRWIQLSAMQQAGEISNLETQVKYELKVNGEKVCSYIADFVYHKKRLPSQTYYTEKVVEDVKSPITRKNPVYRLKKKLLKACYGIDIVEV